MTTETALLKRPALYKGEVGLFPNDPMAQEDIDQFAINALLLASLSCPRTIEALRFLWGVVHKTVENTDIWLDKDAAMDDLKRRAHYTKTLYDRKTNELVARPKSLKHISSEQLRLLTDRIMDIICADVLPGMKKNDLRREIEEMVGVQSKNE